jgi:hypothetical protein
MHHKNSAAGKCPAFSEIVLMKSTQTRFHESAVKGRKGAEYQTP